MYFKYIILTYNFLHIQSFYKLNLDETHYMYKCYECNFVYFSCFLKKLV